MKLYDFAWYTDNNLVFEFSRRLGNGRLLFESSRNKMLVIVNIKASSRLSVIRTTNIVSIRVGYRTGWKGWIKKKIRPKVEVCLRYQRIPLTTCQWSIFKKCMNWQILLNSKKMSRQVKSRYWRHLTVLWYNCGSSKVTPLKTINLVDVDMGVDRFGIVHVNFLK